MSQKKTTFNVAVAGATGAVGGAMLEVLERRNFPVAEVRLLASERSVGKKLQFKGREIAVQLMTKDAFAGIDIALFSAGAARSLEFGPAAAAAGAVVVDNSSAFRMDPEIPLVVPEVNPHAIAQYTKRGIIANPNCSTIQMLVALKPIHDRARIKRIVVSTYQAVSGTGAKAIEELEQQVRAWVAGNPISHKVYPHQIAFNLIPQIGDFEEDGATGEERKIVAETRKILRSPEMRLSATAVRVPVFNGHSQSVNIELDSPYDLEEVRDLLDAQPGVLVQDAPADLDYPMPLPATTRDEVFVGRLRRDPSIDNGLNQRFDYFGLRTLYDPRGGPVRAARPTSTHPRG